MASPIIAMPCTSLSQSVSHWPCCELAEMTLTCEDSHNLSKSRTTSHFVVSCWHLKKTKAMLLMPLSIEIPIFEKKVQSLDFVPCFGLRCIDAWYFQENKTKTAQRTLKHKLQHRKLWSFDNRFEVNWPPEPTLVLRWISKFFSLWRTS